MWLLERVNVRASTPDVEHCLAVRAGAAGVRDTKSKRRRGHGWSRAQSAPRLAGLRSVAMRATSSDAICP